MFNSFTLDNNTQFIERIKNMIRVKVGGFEYDKKTGFDWFKYLNDPLEAGSLEKDLIKYIKLDEEVFDVKILNIEEEKRDLIIKLLINNQPLEITT